MDREIIAFLHDKESNQNKPLCAFRAVHKHGISLKIVRKSKKALDNKEQMMQYLK